MTDNVVRLPRPRSARPQAEALGFFIRAGRNDHKELLHLMAGGEKSVFGFVIEAQNATRHRDLINEARGRGLDVILDPKTQQLGLPGGYTAKLGELPWAADQHHRLSDFDGASGRAIADAIIEFAVSHRFTQLLLPTHVLSGPNDPWLRRDIQVAAWVSQAVKRRGADLDLIYSLAVPLSVLRQSGERGAIVHALEDAQMDELWLRIENFGDDASGEKTAAFIQAAREFHQLGVPLVADNVGGLPGLAALSFGAVGGIAHGVTMNQSFSAARWRQAPKDADDEDDKPKGRALPWRVYLPGLDMLMKRADAEAFFAVSPRIRGRHVCKDTHCCPHGQRDMLGRAARHALYQQAREVDWVSKTPQGLRAARYVDERVRRVSDDVAAAAALTGLSEQTQKALAKKQASTSRFRQVIGHLASDASDATVAMAPRRRSAR